MPLQIVQEGSRELWTAAGYRGGLWFARVLVGKGEVRVRREGEGEWSVLHLREVVVTSPTEGWGEWRKRRRWWRW